MDIFELFTQSRDTLTIHLEGCYLTPLKKKELLKIRGWFRDMDLAREAFGMIAKDHILDQVVRDYFRNIFSSSMEILGIWTDENKDGKPVLEGFINYSVYMDPELTGRIGIVVGNEKRRNSGLGTTALKGALYYMFDYINIHAVELDTAYFNSRAQRCFYKCGFVKTGEVTDINLIHGDLVHKVTMRLSREDFMNSLETHFSTLPRYEKKQETDSRR